MIKQNNPIIKKKNAKLIEQIKNDFGGCYWEWSPGKPDLKECTDFVIKYKNGRILRGALRSRRYKDGGPNDITITDTKDGIKKEYYKLLRLPEYKKPKIYLTAWYVEGTYELQKAVVCEVKDLWKYIHDGESERIKKRFDDTYFHVINPYKFESLGYEVYTLENKQPEFKF